MSLRKSLTFPTLALIFSLLCACTTQPSFIAEQNALQENPVAIKNVYVYSFLDARADFFGADFLKELQAQVEHHLAAQGVKSEWLWYEQSTMGSMSSLQVMPNGDGSMVRLPVPMTVLLNRADERKAQATHRLIIFPRSVGLAGVQMAEHMYYATIAWTLIDVSTNKVLLQGRSDTWGKPFQASDVMHDQVARVVDDFMAVPYPPVKPR